MKLVVFSFFAIFLIQFASAKPADERYTTKYDNINVEKIINNERLLKNYVNCLLDRGSCTPDAADLKEFLPDALENDCNKCTEKQLEGTRKVLKFLIDERPETYAELEAVYDPTGKYKTKYCKFVKEEGLKVDNC